MIGGMIIITILAVLAGIFFGTGIFLEEIGGWIMGGFTTAGAVITIFVITTKPPLPMSSSKGWEIDTMYTIKNGEKIDVEYIVKEKQSNHAKKVN